MSIKAKVCGVITAIMGLFIGCKSYTDVTVVESKALIENSDIVVVDVRTPKEFKAGHIDGAINIDYKGENFVTKMSDIDRKMTLLLYCGAGVRSLKGIKAIDSLKFERVYNLVGGYDNWISSTEK